MQQPYKHLYSDGDALRWALQVAKGLRYETKGGWGGFCCVMGVFFHGCFFSWVCFVTGGVCVMKVFCVMGVLCHEGIV